MNHSFCNHTVRPPNTTISTALSQTEADTVARRISSQPTWITVATIAHALARITGTTSETASPAAGIVPSRAVAQACAMCGDALAIRNTAKKTTTGSRSSNIFKFDFRRESLD